VLIAGRSGEVDTVLELLRQATTGGPARGVVLHGPTGIGKTSVARQLADAAADAVSGATTLRNHLINQIWWERLRQQPHGHQIRQRPIRHHVDLASTSTWPARAIHPHQAPVVPT